MRLRPMTWVAALVLSAVACGDDDKSEECPEPTPTIVAPDDVGPDLRSAPVCKRPDPETMLAPPTR